MKKFLLSLAAALLSIPTFAADSNWIVCGSYCDWSWETATTLSGSGNELSCTISRLIPGFKILDTEAGWDSQLGTATPIEIGVPVVLEGIKNGQDPADMNFKGLIQSVTNAHVKFNVSTKTLVIEADEDDIDISYPALYATGKFCNWDAPGSITTPRATCDKNTGIYTVKINFGDESFYPDADMGFKLAGIGWSNQIGGGVEVTNTSAADVTIGGSNLITTLTGEQTLTFNYNTMKMTFGDPSLVGGESGVNAIVDSENDDPVYFNLQGIRVAEPISGNIYIVRRGSKTTKVIR